jgi:hypothetical protein
MSVVATNAHPDPDQLDIQTRGKITRDKVVLPKCIINPVLWPQLIPWDDSPQRNHH